MKASLSLLAACLLCACSQIERQPALPQSVCVAAPEGGEESSTRTFAGVVEEDENISLGFKTAGQLKQILVKEGDHVRSGQLLAVLDDADYKLGVEALQIQYDQLKDEVERASRLFEKRSMSANDYEKARAGLQQLGVQLQVNKNKLAYTRLYAPASGIIESVNFSPAEMVDAGSAVFNMISKGTLKVVCDIPAGVYLRKDDIRELWCRVSHAGDSLVGLRMVSIVPKADSNQLYRLRMTVDGQAAGTLTSGMNVEVSVVMGGNSAHEYVIPSSAVFRRDGKACVWTVNPDSTVTAREIVLTGELAGDKVGVESGISADDTIVRAGVSRLHDGEKVRVIERPSETNVGGLL